MKPELLSEAIGMIDDDIIEAADKARAEAPKKKSRTPLWIGFGSMAACAAIIASVALNNIEDSAKLPTADMTESIPTSSQTTDADNGSDTTGSVAETLDVIEEDELVETTEYTMDATCEVNIDDENPGAGGDWLDDPDWVVDDVPPEAEDVTVETKEAADVAPTAEAAPETGESPVETAEATVTVEIEVETAEIELPETIECETGDVCEETLEMAESIEGTGEVAEETGDVAEETSEIEEVVDETLETGVYIETAGQTSVVAKAEFPELKYPWREDFTTQAEYDRACNAYFKQLDHVNRNVTYTNDVSREFLAESTRVFLSGHEGENVAYSPVNTYIALAMLAETSDGTTQQQILDSLDVAGLSTLRRAANGLWARFYKDEPEYNYTSRIATSLWLRSGFGYDIGVIESLKNNYYTSSFAGQMGDPLYDQTLQQWLNEQTGGLLSEQAGNATLSPDTVMAMASTVYYNAQWNNEFSEDATTVQDFHKADGTAVQTEFMNKMKLGRRLYTGDGFSAVSLSVAGSDTMWLILPDEGVTPEQIAQGDALYDFLFDMKKTGKGYFVNLSVPKFDVTTQTDLISGLQKLGITDAFSEDKADFTPLHGDEVSSYVGRADNAVRVSINEKGVSAASFVMTANPGTGAFMGTEEIDFVLDRPFLFVIERNTLPLFCGIVNQP